MEWQHHKPVQHSILAYASGCLYVQKGDDQQAYTQPIALSQTGCLETWGGLLQPETWQANLDSLFTLKPDLILIGLPYPPSDPWPYNWLIYARSQGVALDIMHTPAACRTYNLLLQDQRNIIAGLHPPQ